MRRTTIGASTVPGSGVEAFSLTPMAWYVIPSAMFVLWVVGQVAVAGPARRASLVSPAIATRSG